MSRTIINVHANIVIYVSVTYKNAHVYIKQ